MNILLLVVGFIMLIKGADYFVESASNIAVKLSVPPIVVGLTIVSLGTSAPEATVSIMAAISERPDMVIGNIVGSNIFNVAMTIGISALIIPFIIKRNIINQELPINLVISIVLFVMIFIGTMPTVSRIDGVILLTLFVLFLAYILWMSRKQNNSNALNVDVDQSTSWFKDIIFTVLGIAGIILGGEFVVDSASKIAIQLGMSEALVGLTIVAIGTSLPELVTSVAAVVKGEVDIAVGNVVGSNIFNILFVTGITATISPITVGDALMLDMIVMILTVIVLYLFARFFQRINRFHGAILVLGYIIYMVYIIIRN